MGDPKNTFAPAPVLDKPEKGSSDWHATGLTSRWNNTTLHYHYRQKPDKNQP